jgi:TDG/mug DNA glycosylase family protein
MTDPLPDIIARRLAVVFCGINPSMSAAAARHHFVGRDKRFWRVIYLAGFTPKEILPENDRTILQHQCGLTTVVQRPTAQAAAPMVGPPRLPAAPLSLPPEDLSSI